jgi:hypothetical protein
LMLENLEDLYLAEMKVDANRFTFLRNHFEKVRCLGMQLCILRIYRSWCTHRFIIIISQYDF